MNLQSLFVNLRCVLARGCLVLLLPLALAACGGGGGGQLASGGVVGTGTAGLTAVGTITSLGAGRVTVNGWSFATAGAAITINGQAATEAGLKIGMVVTVQGVTPAGGGASAVSIDYKAEVRGVVSGVDSAGLAFTVLGQHVRTNAQTVFDGGTFDTLINQYVEVSGFRSSPGELIATRVEIQSAVIQGAPLTVRGVIMASNPASRTFQVGAQVVDYAQVPIAFLPPVLANGTVVDVNATTISTGDRLIANAIALVPTTIPGNDSSQVELEGIITYFANLGSFQVNGQVVDGRGATVTGVAGAVLGDGVKVEVKGRLLQSVVVASTIEVEQAAAVSIDGAAEAVNVVAGTVTVAGHALRVNGATQFEDKSAAAVRNFGLDAIRVGDHLFARAARTQAELVATRIERLDLGAPPPTAPSTKAEGLITEFASAASFKVGGRMVNANSAKFENGNAGDLANGKRVAAEGTLSGEVLMASKVEFKSDGAPPGEVSVEGSISAFVSPANFNVAGQQVDASGATFEGGTVADLANGRRVEATGTINGAGILIARKVSIETAPGTPTLEVEGSIRSFVSVANFTVDGQRVDASKATFKNGTAADLANGRDITAKGPVVAGVLQAASVEFHDSGEQSGAEAEGKITNFVSPSNFVVAGRTIDASVAAFSHGTIADLANDRKVEVSGKLVGAVLVASKVDFDD
ncbi:MAG: DUF5666 domain-containing protein [Casimicrobiaceae bacterium]